MKQLIIIFEFKQGNLQKQDSFKNLIRNYERYAFITNNSCIIWTNDTAAMVRDNIKTDLGLGDKLFIGKISAPAAWISTLSQRVTDYLQKNLK